MKVAAVPKSPTRASPIAEEMEAKPMIECGSGNQLSEDKIVQNMENLLEFYREI